MDLPGLLFPSQVTVTSLNVSLREKFEAYTACLPQTFMRSFTNCEDPLIVYIKRYILMLCTVTLHKSPAEYQEVQVEEIALQ